MKFKNPFAGTSTISRCSSKSGWMVRAPLWKTMRAKRYSDALRKRQQVTFHKQVLTIHLYLQSPWIPSTFLYLEIKFIKGNTASSGKTYCRFKLTSHRKEVWILCNFKIFFPKLQDNPTSETLWWAPGTAQARYWLQDIQCDSVGYYDKRLVESI